ncbi:MAG: hypothetical protein IKR04_07165 [Clostridia bacterium]|nr:hypothetical protein [Clostridia bacterium]
MNTNSRTRNSAVNLFVNVAYQLFIVFITFFTRRIFISVLGVELLGVSGLFDNIFSVLALAELGISGAITYSMYKYIVEDNKPKLIAITNYYKKLYNRIAIIVGTLGILLLPFLRLIVNADAKIPHLEIYYLLTLANTVSSYLFVYKTTIVSADQKGYRLKLVNSVVEVLKLLTQLAVLFIFKKYMIYIFVSVVFTLISNIISSSLSQKWYSFLNGKDELTKEEKKSIWNNIKSMFFYKIGGVVMNHTDNILISIIVNTATVGLYSNYNMIFRKLDGYCNLIFSSLSASVGNLNVTATKERKYFIFKVFMLIAFSFFAVATVGIYFCRSRCCYGYCSEKRVLIVF